MNIQLYANKVTTEAEPYTMNVYLQGVELDELVAQLNARDLLDALRANDQYADIVEYVKENPDE